MSARAALRVIRRDGQDVVFRGRTYKRKKVRLPKKPAAMANALAGGGGLMRINMLLAKPAAYRIGTVQELLKKILRDTPRLEGTFLARLANPEWESLLMKARHVLDRIGARSSEYVAAVKGLLLEIAVVKSDEFAKLQARMAAKLKALPRNSEWGDTLHVVTGARTLDGREIGDVLLVAYSRDRKKVWVMAIVESKSESNALALIDHASQGSGQVVQLIGQHGTGVQRIGQSGLRIAGDKFDAAAIHVGKPKMNYPLTHEAQTTEFVGFVPPDTQAYALGRLTEQGPRQGVQVHTHSIHGKDATKAAQRVADEVAAAAGQ